MSTEHASEEYNACERQGPADETPSTPEPWARDDIFDEMKRRQDAEKDTAPGDSLDLGQATRDLAEFLRNHHKKDWTSKHAPELYAIWRQYFIMQHAFRNLERAIRNASIVSGKDAILRAVDQMEGAYCSLFNEALQHREQLIRSLERRQKDGRRGKGAARAFGLDWDTICRKHDQWVADGIPMPKIIQRLANDPDRPANAQVICSGLRKRGRGLRSQKPGMKKI